MIPADVLSAIERFDPDGGSVEPTEADYAAFQAWVIKTYGDRAWREYSRGGWAGIGPE